MWRWYRFLAKLPVQFIFTAMAGFDIGLVVHSWNRWGPFMLYREMNVSLRTSDHAGPWRLGIFFNPRALDEFYEGSTK